MLVTVWPAAIDSVAKFVADASYFARRTILESKGQVACISGKTNDHRYDSRFQTFTAATWVLHCQSEVHRCSCFHLRVYHDKKRISGQTKFYVGNVCNMMSVPAEETERLAEIFREMLALSKASRSNHSQSAMAGDSIELSNAQATSGACESCKAKGKQPSGERSETEDHEPRG